MSKSFEWWKMRWWDSPNWWRELSCSQRKSMTWFWTLRFDFASKSTEAYHAMAWHCSLDNVWPEISQNLMLIKMPVSVYTWASGSHIRDSFKAERSTLRITLNDKNCETKQNYSQGQQQKTLASRVQHSQLWTTFIYFKQSSYNYHSNEKSFSTHRRL